MSKKTKKSEFTNPFCAEAVLSNPIMDSGYLNSTSIRPSDHMIVPQGCGWKTKIICAGALAACGGICYVSLGTACVSCLAALGKSKCLSCFT